MSRILTQSFMLLCLIALGAMHAAVAGQPDPDLVGRKPGSFCMPANIPVCGAQVRIDPSPVGAITTVTMPEQFVTRSFMVQCLPGYNTPYFAVLQTNGSLCEVKKCKAGGRVEVCGAVLAVDKEASLGEEVKINVPDEAVIPSRRDTTPSFSARCTLNAGSAEYEFVSSAGLSCNDFTCEPTTLKMCGDAVHLREPGELGEVVELRSDKDQPVRVECLASGGKRPSYVIVDSTGMGCH